MAESAVTPEYMNRKTAGPEPKGMKIPLGCCPTCVPQGSVGLLENNGSFVKVLQPGCTCVCFPFESVQMVDLRLQQLSCSSDSKTKDNVTVTVTSTVQYRVDPMQVTAAIYTIAQPKQTINALIDDCVRSELPKMTLDGAYENKANLVSEIKRACHAGISSYGYEVMSVLITDLRPDAQVLNAMNQINSARRLREAALDRAEADKILAVKAGEAEAETKYLSGVGVARMRTAITDGFSESISKMGDNGLQPREVVNMMLVNQYLDVLKEFAASGKGSIVVPHGLGATSDMQSAVREGFLTAQKLA